MNTLPPKHAARSRLLIGQNGPSDSALAAASGWRLLAAQPLTGTRRAALLETCARAAPLGAIRPRLSPASPLARAGPEHCGDGSWAQKTERAEGGALPLPLRTQ